MATLEQLRESTSDSTLPAFAWPGGYPMYYITRDGLTICPECANNPNPNGIDPEMISDPVIAGDVYWEGPTLTCDDQGEPIESAYGDPDADDDPEPEPDDDPEPEPSSSPMMAAFRPFAATLRQDYARQTPQERDDLERAWNRRNLPYGW